MLRKWLAGAFLSLGLLFIGAGLWIPAKGALAQVLLDNAWNKTRATGVMQKPWPWADTGPVAKLSMTRTGDDWIVLGGASGQSMAFGPSMMDAAYLPQGVTLIAAHRDTHFRTLKHVRIGDTIAIEYPDQPLVQYKILETKIVHKDKVRLRQNTQEDLLVLVTCYPFDALVAGGPLRFVVLAEKI